MHGLVNKALQCFLRDTFGPEFWGTVAHNAQLGFEGFETLAEYDLSVTETVVSVAVELLGRPREVLFDDLGTYLVSHPNSEALRRLLRFGGSTFVDFLQSMDDLPDQARLALPDFRLPPIEVIELSADTFRVHFQSPIEGGAHLLVGLLRALADDYGALAVMDHHGTNHGAEVIGVQLLDRGFAKGRSFDLSMAGQQ